MFALAAESEFTGILEVLAELQGEARTKLRRVAEFIGIRTVEYLKSYTGELRPPAHPGGSARPAHPGHWADVTRQLMQSYGFRVTDEPAAVVLELFNTAEYAVWLELREGYFVLRGVTDPGGPVEDALRRAVAELAPGWEVVTGG